MPDLAESGKRADHSARFLFCFRRDFRAHLSRFPPVLLFFVAILTIGIFVLFHIICLSRLAVTTSHWLSPGQPVIVEERHPRPLTVCGEQGGAVVAETRFAVVSIMSGAFGLYGIRCGRMRWLEFLGQHTYSNARGFVQRCDPHPRPNSRIHKPASIHLNLYSKMCMCTAKAQLVSRAFSSQ